MSKLPFSSRLSLECAGIFFFSWSQQEVYIICLPNGSEPFASFLWVQEGVESMCSILRMQQSKEFSLVYGSKQPWMFPFLPAYEDKCGFMDIDYKYRSINIITGLILILDSPWLPVFICLYGNISALHISPPQAFWGSWGLPCRCPFISFRPGLLCGCQPSGVSESLSRAVRWCHYTGYSCLCHLSVAELKICCLCGTFHDSAGPDSPAGVCHFRPPPPPPPRKSCSCCFQNLIPVGHLISPSR